MDESFLSDAKLIKASKAFVCIRLATYEDKAEAEFLKSIFRGRSGELENTVFCLLDPTGHKKLSRSGRSPQFAYRTPGQMAKAMTEIARTFAKKSESDKTSPSEPNFPQMKSVRLALNVASCDNLPCLIVSGKDKVEVEAAKKRLAKVIWDDELAGKFVLASTVSPKDMKTIAGGSKPGIYVVAPDDYGLKGKTIKRLAIDAKPDQAKSALVEIAGRFNIVEKDHRKHVTTGKRRGIDWESEIPVTDPGALRARSRSKNRRKKIDRN